jgi:hypothetical protein
MVGVIFKGYNKWWGRGNSHQHEVTISARIIVV